MSTTELKSNLHQLIDNIENPELLQSVYEILDAHKQSEIGGLWSSLSEDQKTEVLEAYDASEKEENLIPHAQVLNELK